MPPSAGGTHVPGRRAQRGEHPIEVHVDDAVPALVGVVLERPLGHPFAVGAHPCRRRFRSRINSGIGEHDIQPAIQGGRRIDRGIERGMIRDVDASPRTSCRRPGHPRGLLLHLRGH